MGDPHQRFVAEGGNDYRTPAQVDRDRILYSTPFLRLAEVTQVVSADRGYVFHNRLTHSLKVAQLARRLAEKLANQRKRDALLIGIDPDVAESAALAHDLGHPPFGHIAEEELDSLARRAGLKDGFNGNAQSFRIVARLAIGDSVAPNSAITVRGLNLTRATLDGILKYPWMRGGNPKQPEKWGAYESESQLFRWTRRGRAATSCRKCAIAELMDWCDDITYAVHDLVDFYRAGQIPLDRLADKTNASECNLFFDAVFTRHPKLLRRRRHLEQVFRGILDFFPIGRRYDGSLAQRRDLWRFTTVLISAYVDATQMPRTDSKSASTYFKITPRARDEIFMLKELTWHYVILRNELATIQHGQRVMVRYVFLTMLKAAKDKTKWSLFPLEYCEELNGAKGPKATTRIVADFVASMTEREIKSLYHSLRGRA